MSLFFDSLSARPIVGGLSCELSGSWSGGESGLKHHMEAVQMDPEGLLMTCYWHFIKQAFFLADNFSVSSELRGNHQMTAHYNPTERAEGMIPNSERRTQLRNTRNGLQSRNFPETLEALKKH